MSLTAAARTGATTPALPPPDGAVSRGLACPAVLDLLRSLTRVVGTAQALSLWSAAAAATGRHGVDLSADVQVVVVTALLDLTDTPAARAVAVSHLTRLRTYRVLATYPGSPS